MEVCKMQKVREDIIHQETPFSLHISMPSVYIQFQGRALQPMLLAGPSQSELGEVQIRIPAFFFSNNRNSTLQSFSIGNMVGKLNRE